jgi:transcriptional regulator with XRE-family HTH domain
MQSIVNADLAYCAVALNCAPCNADSMRIRLTEFRNKLEMTLEQMAERSGFSESMLSRWEKGKANIPSGRLPDLASAYECRVSDIFAEDDEPVSTALTEGELEAMVALAQQEVTLQTPLGAYPRIVASSLHEQLRRLEAAGPLRLNPDEASAPDKASRSRAATRPSARA